MSNLAKQKREKIEGIFKQIIESTTDDNTVIAIKEIETEINNKKYGLLWEEHYEQVDLEMKTKVPVFSEDISREIVSQVDKKFNFLLEGDNLHSLKLLEKTHRRNIDVIYIDPPYNTGAKDWKYDNNYVDKEDGFRHSKWLSMMNNRLVIAKNLLKTDGVLICAIDENELATTILLLKEIFGPNYKVDCITIIHNPRGVQGSNFSYIHEYAIFVYNKSYKVIGNRELEPEDIDWSNLRNWGSESERSDAKNCFYPIIVKDGEIIGFGDVLDDSVHPQQTEFIEEEGSFYIYPIDINGIERKWRYARQSVESIKDLLRVKENNGRYEIEIGKNFASYKTVWTDKKYDANEYGTQLVNSMVKDNDFDFPKSLYNVYDCLYAVIKDKPNAIVLDYFAGSGTTGHAVMLMNEKLGGDRKFILCTNNAVGEKKEKEFKNVYGLKQENESEWIDWEEKYGIARSITYKRIKAAIKGYEHSKDVKTILFEKKLTINDLKRSEKLLEKVNKIVEENKNMYTQVKSIIENGNFKVLGIVKKGIKVNGMLENLKYYKTEYIDKQAYDDDGYDVKSKLLNHITEMVQIEHGVRIDGETYKIIFTDEEIDMFTADKTNLTKCKKVYISSQVLLTKEQEVLFNELGIDIILIPEYYFRNELREVEEI